MKKLLFAALYLGSAAFFAICALWQLNDPDAILWACMYAVAALGGVLVHLERLPRSAAAGYGVITFLIGLYHAWVVISERQHYFDEMGREMMGALLVSLYMGVLYLGIRSQPHR